ncbi:hypothetical protein [Flammeovirga kamogawensis]|uniref:Nicotinate-nucleotide adenylyltransferase n=1 Tax=Flammeovirga kamogawensis TaxID=373891 RepID=A0ABX8H2Z3_9BACT|nr:hypothetical protein [Flammeovirga kamogawensis]MBB6462402.1 hypothetical protein [Flammeovirga kamogawensis]QWG09515.1 hypothetical protein KM029_23190 [Flammeovirga kamogawensis]TRX65031.1 hypothetical protein EO216_21090 [Flammeovirga kamogawensis]
MKKGSTILIVIMLSIRASFSFGQTAETIRFNEVNDSDFVISELVDHVYNEDPHLYIGKIVSINYDLIEEEIYNLYDEEAIETLSILDYYKVDIITEDGYEERYYDKEGTLYLVISDFNKSYLPYEIVNQIDNQYLAWNMTVLEISSPDNSDKKIYKVHLKQEEEEQVFFFEHSGGMFTRV